MFGKMFYVIIDDKATSETGSTQYVSDYGYKTVSKTTTQLDGPKLHSARRFDDWHAAHDYAKFLGILKSCTLEAIIPPHPTR